jgi:hypothetical protein
MTRAREAVAADFLRKALAAKAVGAPQLDMMARVAGLLGEGQSITHAKVFRQAKKSLGIRSIRDGFGAGGGWAWELPRRSEEREPCASSVIPQSMERLLPREWVEGIAQLEQHRPPARSASPLASVRKRLQRIPERAGGRACRSARLAHDAIIRLQA